MTLALKVVDFFDKQYIWLYNNKNMKINTIYVRPDIPGVGEPVPILLNGRNLYAKIKTGLR